MWRRVSANEFRPFAAFVGERRGRDFFCPSTTHNRLWVVAARGAITVHAHPLMIPNCTYARFSTRHPRQAIMPLSPL